MDRSYRKGQALIETLILGISLMSFLLLIQNCEKKMKRKYDAYKIQKKILFKKRY